jgi:O-antigen biosynthesis protein
MTEFQDSKAQVKYTATIDLANKNNSHTLTYEMVQRLQGQSLKILEVGCSSGYLGYALKAVGHHVTGVEMDSAAAAEAQKVLDEVFFGTVQDFFIGNPEKKYDVIMFADVLEHIADPADVLYITKQHLNANGHLIVSVPNVAHIGVRWMLARGEWNYEDIGIMDRTHLRFFTKATLIDLMSISGFEVQALERTMMPEHAYLERYGLSNKDMRYQAFRTLVMDDMNEDFQYILMAVSSPQNASTSEKNVLWLQKPLLEHFPTLYSKTNKDKRRLYWRVLRHSLSMCWQNLTK